MDLVDLRRERKACLFVCRDEKIPFPKENVPLFQTAFAASHEKNLFYFDKKQFLFSCQASKDSLRNASAFLVSGVKSA